MAKRTKTKHTIRVTREELDAALLVALLKYVAPTLDVDMAFEIAQLLYTDGLTMDSVDHYGELFRGCVATAVTGTLEVH